MTRTRRVVAAAGLLLLLAAGAARAQFVLVTNQIAPFQYEVFFADRLELVNNAPLNFNGPVHANGDFYVGTSQTTASVFNASVTLGGSLVQVTNWAGATNLVNGPLLSGGLQTNVHLIQMAIATNTPAGRREMLYPPPAGESSASGIGEYRYFNRAQLVILVSNTTVTGWAKQGIADTTSNTIPWQNSLSIFLTTNLQFYDQREQKTIRVTQLNLFEYRRWATTNQAVRNELGLEQGGLTVNRMPNLIYIADFRTNDFTHLNGIRIINAQNLPTNNLGLTIATPNPLYVWGDYNCPTAALGTTNTTGAMPAAFFCDAFTLLSTNWHDSYSTSNYNVRVATHTTVNAAICAGMVYSTGPDYGQYSGGANNLVRLLEAWSSKTNTINGSLVNLYDSAQATGDFVDPGQTNIGRYYSSPVRKYSHDSKFLNLATLPPGTPWLLQVYATNPIFFLLQPVGRTNVVGPPMVFMVQAADYENKPLTYQWYFNGTPLVDGTNALLTRSQTQVADSGNYQVVVTDGFNSATSVVAKLAVFAPPRWVTARLEGKFWQLSYAGTPGGRYELQTTTSLVPPVTWLPSGIMIMNDSSLSNLSLANPVVEPLRYYRVVLK